MDKFEKMDGYFREYREKRSMAENLASERTGLMQQMQTLDMEQARINAEINSMKRVISLMIEHDMDLIEAKLRVNEDQPILLCDTYNDSYDQSTISLSQVFSSATSDGYDFAPGSISWGQNMSGSN